MRITHVTRGRVRGLTLALLVLFSVTRIALGAEGRPTSTNYVAGRSGAAQLARPAASVTELLQCLLGPDVIVSNAVLTGAPQAAGTFVGALGVIGFDQGIILSSGDIGTLAGPNTGDATSTISATPGDPDLDALIPGYTTYDAVVLEFDFTCPTPQDVVFQYVFGSEEYNEWVDTPFNDVFGFFLNGVEYRDSARRLQQRRIAGLDQQRELREPLRGHRTELQLLPEQRSRRRWRIHQHRARRFDPGLLRHRHDPARHQSHQARNRRRGRSGPGLRRDDPLPELHLRGATGHRRLLSPLRAVHHLDI